MFRVSLAIIDFQLPTQNGIELSRDIKADARIDGTRLILISGFDPPERAVTAAAGIVRFLAKPARRSQLLDCIAEAFGRHHPDLSTPHQQLVSAVDLPATPERRDERILLVEDNAVNHRLAILQLKKLGYVASSAYNGREAVDALEKDRYDLVLMDCQMPEMDGFAATVAIRHNERRKTSRHVPIVAMTANARPQDREACLAAGMDGYVAKPVRLDDLRGALEHWLKPDAPSLAAK